MTEIRVGVLGRDFVLRAKDKRFRRLFEGSVSRLPREATVFRTLKLVSLSKRPTKTMVGLTRYSRVRYFLLSRPKQTITFYAVLLDALSDEAATAVIAHELAHVWLNEHVRPEESKEREREADALARRWGFGAELDALDREAETVR